MISYCQRESSCINLLSSRRSTNDQLTSISNRSDRRDIRAASGLSTNKAEDECEDYAQKRDANVLLVLQAEDEAGEEGA